MSPSAMVKPYKDYPSQKGKTMKHILQISGPSGSEKEVLDPAEDPMVAYEEAVENAHYGDTITLYIEEDGALGVLENTTLT